MKLVAKLALAVSTIIAENGCPISNRSLVDLDKRVEDSFSPETMQSTLLAKNGDYKFLRKLLPFVPRSNKTSGNREREYNRRGGLCQCTRTARGNEVCEEKRGRIVLTRRERVA